MYTVGQQALETFRIFGCYSKTSDLEVLLSSGNGKAIGLNLWLDADVKIPFVVFDASTSHP